MLLKQNFTKAKEFGETLIRSYVANSINIIKIVPKIIEVVMSMCGFTPTFVSNFVMSVLSKSGN